MTKEASPVADDSDRQALARAGDTRRPRFLWVARAYSRRRSARALDGVWVSGLDEARAALAGSPLIFAANHVAWWDTALLVLLDDYLGGIGWAVMDAANLRALPFLGWLGALPLDRTSHRRSRECLEAAADLLDRPGRAMWIFPQGRQRPAHLRPLDLKPGIGVLHARSPVDIVAVSLDYVFLERDRPAAIIRFSAPMAGDALGGVAVPAAVETRLLEGLDVIDKAVLAATDGRRARTHPHDPLPGFTALVPPPRTSAWQRLGERMLRALRRRRSHAG